MVESLIAGKAVLVNIEDRTQVINLKEWNISEDDIVHIYDHGGHWIYSITTPLFVSKDSILFLVHDVTKVQPEEIKQTTDVLRLAFHQYPNNKMYIIFTHTDLIDANEVAENSDFLMCKMWQYLDDEIKNLNKLLIQKKSEERQDIVDDTAHLLDQFKDKESNMPFFCVSSENYSGMKEVKECLVKVAKEKRVAVPESWIEFYKEITETKKIYLTLNETLELFQGERLSLPETSDGVTKLERIFHFFQRVTQCFRGASQNMPETSDVAVHPESESFVPLQYFADSNLCLHYENNPFLKDFVFPDIDLLADLFKSLFHHNLTNVVNYDNDENLQAKFQKAECDLAVQRYQREGLLTKKLLSYL